MKLTDNEKRRMIPLGAAAVLFLCALLIPMHKVLALILCAFSFLCAFFDLASLVLADLKEKRWKSRRLLLTLAGILTFFTGAGLSAAGMMLIYRLGALLLFRRRARTLEIVNTRRELEPVGRYTAGYEQAPRLTGRLERFCSAYLIFFLLLAALLTGVLTVLLTDGGLQAGIRRFAVLLALGCEASLFAAYGPGDYAAVVRAAEKGVVFGPGALGKLYETNLLCVQPGERMAKGDALVSSADAAFLDPNAVLLLSAHAWSYSVHKNASRLAELYGKAISRSTVQGSQSLRGYGVVARVHDAAVVSGSAAFMEKAGLPLVPFHDGDTAAHLGVNGRYAGCVYFNGKDIPEAELNTLAGTHGFYLFRDAADAAEKRQPEERLLFASADGQRGAAEARDVYAALGGFGRDADVYVRDFGYRGVCQLLLLLNNARLLRKGCFLFTCAVKAAAALLAVFGFCPLWLAVLLETAASYFTLTYVLRGLDYEPGA